MSKRREFHVARELKVRLSDSGDFLASVSRSSGDFFLAAELLLLLQQIQRSKAIDAGLGARLRKALGELERLSPPDEEIEDLVQELHGAGLLVAKDGRARKDALLEDGFGDPWIQWAMLADRRRGLAYETALRAAVDDGSVVVDVGAGTGLLSAMAFEAGARRVLAIEETASARGIVSLLKTLGLPATKPRFELFQGNSTEAPLPEATTHVVSELFGNDPFCEGVIPTLRDVGARLPPGKARWIPSALELFVEIDALLGSPVHERVAALWKARASATGQTAVAGSPKPRDFQAEFLAHAAKSLPLFPLSFTVPLARGDLKRLAEPRSLGTIRLDPPTSPIVAFSGRVPLAFDARTGRDPKKGKAHPLVLVAWYRVVLDRRTTLSNHPDESDACGHWSPIVVPLAPAACLESGAAEVKFALSPYEDRLHVEVWDGRGVRIGGR